LDDQPARRVPYTFNLETHKKNRIPHFINVLVLSNGLSCQSMRAKIKDNTGAMKYGDWLASDGLVISLVKSLAASAKGCGRPAIPTLFGPFRVWKYPSPLRSNKVKKATARRTQM